MSKEPWPAKWMMSKSRPSTAAARPARVAFATGERGHLEVDVRDEFTQPVDHLQHVLARREILGRVLDREDAHRRVLVGEVAARRRQQPGRDDPTERLADERPVGVVAHHLPGQVQDRLVDDQQQRRSIEVPEQLAALGAQEHVAERGTDVVHRRASGPLCQADAPAPPAEPVDPVEQPMLVVASEGRVALPGDGRSLDVQADEELQRVSAARQGSGVPADLQLHHARLVRRSWPVAAVVQHHDDRPAQVNSLRRLLAAVPSTCGS